MASKAFKQDLPPEGGYAPVNFKRIPARTIIQGNISIHTGDEIPYKSKLAQIETSILSQFEFDQNIQSIFIRWLKGCL